MLSGNWAGYCHHLKIITQRTTRGLDIFIKITATQPNEKRNFLCNRFSIDEVLCGKMLSNEFRAYDQSLEWNTMFIVECFENMKCLKNSATVSQ